MAGFCECDRYSLTLCLFVLLFYHEGGRQCVPSTRLNDITSQKIALFNEITIRNIIFELALSASVNCHKGQRYGTYTAVV
jgi:hypothetical protein